MDDPLFTQMMLGWAAILGTLLSIVAGYAVRLVISYVKTKMSQDQFVYLKEAAQTTVRYIEMASAWDAILKEGAAKKERALILMSNWAFERGIPLTPMLADQLIEEAVNLMKNEIGEVWNEGQVAQPCTYVVTGGV